MPQIAAARPARAKRPPIFAPLQYFLEASIGTNRTTTHAATASHAARDRDRTSAAATTPAPSDPSNAPNGLRAVTVHQTSDGSPITAMCATKLRLPKVPPGALLVLKYSVSNPYACARQNNAAQPVAIAAAIRIGR